MKKILNLLMVFALLATLTLSVLAIEANDAVITCIDDAKPGDSVTVVVEITNTTGIGGMAADVKFDKEQLEFVGYTAYSGMVTTPAKNVNGKINIQYASTENIENDFELISINFKVKDTASIGKTDITFVPEDGTQFYYNEQKEIDFDFNVTNGYVNIKGQDFPTLSLTGIGTDPITYDGQAHNVSVSGIEGIDGAKVAWTVNGNDYVNDEGKDNQISFTSASTYEIEATVTAPGYNDTKVNGTLTINKANLSVDDITITKEYDGTTAVDTSAVTVTANGVQGTDDLSFQLDEITLDSPDADTYTINSAAVKVDGDEKVLANYNLTVTAKVTVNVTKRPIIVTAQNASKKVDTDDPKLDATYTGTLAAGHTISCFVTREAGEAVKDSYVITAVATIKDAENNDVTKNYDITYKKGTFSIVDKTLKEIKITTEPTKKAYVEDEKLDLTGMVVTAYYDNDTSEVVYNSEVNKLTAPTEYTFTAEDVGKKTIVVAFGGITTTFDVTVYAKELQSITLDTTNVQKSFKVGTTFNYDNLKVIPVYNNNVTYDALTSGYTVSTPNMNTLGEQTITVSYTDNSVTKTASYEITIVDKELDSLSYSGNVQTVYVEGTKFDKTNLVVTAHYDNGTSSDHRKQLW